jgi:ADP-L-glycero-D-manno-heptose 6-epimerase
MKPPTPAPAPVLRSRPLLSVARKSLVVTGGAGFIGRNLVAALNARGEEGILIVDRLGTTEKWKNLLGLRFDDVIDIDEFRARVRDDRMPAASTVFHLGACSATTERDADFLLDNNTRYTRELCEACLRAGTRFVYASSAATYGSGETGYFDRDDTTLRLEPLNMYGYSKHLFDLWALRTGALAKIAGLKYFNVYGPYEDHKEDMRSVVHKAFHQILETGEVSLFKSYRPDYADGEQVRDFVYVQDAVAMTLFFHDHPEANGLFNCGTGRARSWLDLGRAVFAAMEREPNIRFIDMPESLRPKYQYFTQADMTKARNAGFTQEFTPLEDGVRDYVQGYLAPRAEGSNG